MSTKKSKLDAPKNVLIKALDKSKNAMKSTNDYALCATEDIVSEGIIVAEQWQTVASTALKASLAIAEKQQNLIFNALNGIKDHVVLSKKRMKQLIA